MIRILAFITFVALAFVLLRRHGAEVWAEEVPLFV